MSQWRDMSTRGVLFQWASIQLSVLVIISFISHERGKVCFMVFSATFNTSSIISWLSVLLVEETGVPEKTTDLSQVTDKLYHITTERGKKDGIVIKEHIRGYLWHRYYIMVKQTMTAAAKLQPNHWFRSFIISNDPLSRKSWYEPQTLE